jgi:hypothetical protein
METQTTTAQNSNVPANRHSLPGTTSQGDHVVACRPGRPEPEPPDRSPQEDLQILAALLEGIDALRSLPARTKVVAADGQNALEWR